MDKKVVLLGVPFDANSSFLPGTALAPPVIRKSFYSESSNMWSENNVNLENAIYDAGDLEGSQREIFNSIESNVSSLLERNEPIVTLGGDHSITFPILKAFHKK